MRKIPCVFQRHGRHGPGPTMVCNVVTPGCEWVLEGRGRATIKWDGTACLVQDGALFKRYDRKPTKAARRRRAAMERRGEPYVWTLPDLKPAPDGFEPCRPLQEPDLVTGHWPGWVPVGLGPEDRWHREAWDYAHEIDGTPPDGTYELLGPRVQANPYDLAVHLLMRHGVHDAMWTLANPVVRTFDGLRAFLEATPHEGIVFWLEDGTGTMAKIRRRDFFLDWPLSGARL